MAKYGSGEVFKATDGNIYYTETDKSGTTRTTNLGTGGLNKHAQYVIDTRGSLGGYVQDIQNRVASGEISADAAQKELSRIGVSASTGGGSSGGGSTGGGGGAGGGGGGGFNYQAEIDRLAELRRRQAIAQLDKSKNAALGQIANERAQVQPRYYQARNDANTQNKLQARNFAEYMANRGLAQSGENDQARLMQNMALQNAIGELKRQEASVYDELGRRETEVENAYQSDLASVEAGLAAQALSEQIAEMRRQDELRRQEEQFRQQLAIQEAGLTGFYNGQQTLDAQRVMQALRNGDIDYQTAVYQLAQLKDPNSFQNRYDALKLQQLETELKYLEPSLQLDLANTRSIMANRGSSGGSSSSSTSAADEKLWQTAVSKAYSENPYASEAEILERAETIYNTYKGVKTQQNYTPSIVQQQPVYGGILQPLIRANLNKYLK
jgi:hypothetical protein